MQIVDGLKRTRDQTLPYFDLPEDELLKTYGEGKWTVREILHHLADAETVLYDRIRRGIANPNQVVWGFDQDAWAKHLAYRSIPMHIHRDIFLNVRTGILYLAEKFYISAGGNPFVHSNTGMRTVKDEFDKVVWHNQRHLDQIKLALQTA